MSKFVSLQFLPSLWVRTESWIFNLNYLVENFCSDKFLSSVAPSIGKQKKKECFQQNLFTWKIFFFCKKIYVETNGTYTIIAFLIGSDWLMFLVLKKKKFSGGNYCLAFKWSMQNKISLPEIGIGLAFNYLGNWYFSNFRTLLIMLWLNEIKWFWFPKNFLVALKLHAIQFAVKSSHARCVHCVWPHVSM